jgi:hypothetical protein
LEVVVAAAFGGSLGSLAEAGLGGAFGAGFGEGFGPALGVGSGASAFSLEAGGGVAGSGASEEASAGEGPLGAFVISAMLPAAATASFVVPAVWLLAPSPEQADRSARIDAAASRDRMVVMK